MVDFNPNTIAKQSEITPIDSMVESIRSQFPIAQPKSEDYFQKAMQSVVTDGKNPNFTYGEAMSATDNTPYFNKPNYNPDNLYVKLNSGEYINRYDTYTPFVNNEEIKAENQTTTDKWANGVTKFLGKTGTAVIGGTIGTLYGLGNSIYEGNLTAIYDNNFSRGVDDINTKMDYKLPNFYTQQERDKNFFQSMGTANFWANDFLGGLSFTTGAIISEGIWAGLTGGASLASTGARWGTKFLKFGTVAKAVDKFTDLTKIPLKSAYNVGNVSKSAGILGGRIGAGANAVRFAVTSTGYEAGVEALHFKKEAEENFLENFKSINGRPPTDEERLKYQDEITNAANAVFGLNTAILIPSNIAMFGGSVLKGIPSPFKPVTQRANKALFGIGAEKTVEGTLKAINPTKFQTIAQNLYKYGKSPIVEGGYEEGMQSVATNMLDNYLKKKYDVESASNTLSIFDGFYDALAETYGTKEGWKEIGIGMLIGGGSNIIMKQDVQEIEQAKAESQEYIDYYNTYQGMTMRDKGLMASQIQMAIKGSSDAKDVVGAHLSANEAIIAQLSYNYAAGKNLDKVNEEYRIALDNVTEAQWKEVGVEEVDIQEYKDTVLEAHKDLTKRYRENRTYSELLLGSTNALGKPLQAEADALAWALTQGENANILMGDIISDMKGKTGIEAADSLQTVRLLKVASSNTKDDIAKTVKDVKDLRKRARVLEQAVLKLQNKPKTPSDVKGVGKVQGDEYFNAVNELNTTQEQLIQKQQELSELATKLSAENDKLNTISDTSLNLDTSVITPESLENLEENLKKVDGLIESYKETSPRTFTTLQSQREQYNKALEQFMSYQALSSALASGKLNFQSKNTWIGKKLAGNKQLDDFTSDFFKELNEYSKKLELESISKRVEQTAETVTTIPNPNKPEFTKPEPKAQLSGAEGLRQRIKEALKSKLVPLIQIGDQDLVKPKQSEIDKYGELYSKGNRKNKSEREEFEQLKERLGKWQLLDSAFIDENQTLADLVEIVEQLESEQEQEDTFEEITEEALSDIAQPSLEDELKESGDLTDYSITQNVNGNVVAKKIKGGKIRFSHLSIESVAQRLNGEIEKRKDGRYLIKPENSSPIEIETDKQGNIIIDAEIYESETFQNAINLYIVRTSLDYTTWSYFDVYEYNGVDFVEKPSDIAKDDITGDIYDLSLEDEVELYVDVDGEYNKGLLKLKDEQEIKKQVRIHVRKKGQNYSVLKSQRDLTDPVFDEIRQLALEALQSGISGVIGKTKVKRIFLGTPKFNLDDNGKPTQFNFSETSVNNVVTQGYILDGEFKLADRTLEKDVLKDFVFKLSRRNREKKIPVVVIKKGAQMIAYPISMIKTSTPKVQEMEDILSSGLMNDGQKIKAINQLLIDNKKKAVLDSLDPQRIEEARQQLQEVKVFQTADNIATATYNKNSLIQDATININIEDINRAISSPKLVIDLANTTFISTLDRKYDTMIEIENALSEEAIALDKRLRKRDGYVDKNNDPIEDKFREVFDDNEVELSPTTSTLKIMNINILKQALDNLTKPAREMLGKQKIDELKNLVARYEMIKKQTSVDKSKINETKNDLEC
jgi:hypothetical protein